MIDPVDLYECAVIPALRTIQMDSPAARALLMGTAAAESGLRHLRQVRGPALGLWQMEPTTYHWLWNEWAPKITPLYADLSSLRVALYQGAGELAWNLQFSAAMARLRYRVVPKPLPAYDDLRGLAEYWKRYYNTHLGAGTIEHFEKSFQIVDHLSWAPSADFPRQ